MVNTIQENTEIEGQLNVDENFSVNTDKLTVNAATGNLVAAGTLTSADYTRYITITPAAMMLDTTASEDPDEGNSGNFGILTFNDTEKNIVYFSFRVPEDWKAGTSIKIEVIWTSATTTGNVEWEIDYTAVPTDGTENTASDGTDAYADAAPTTTLFVLTTGDNLAIDSGDLAAGDMVGVQLFRNAGTNAEDTMAGSALLIAANVKYTATR